MLFWISLPLARHTGSKLWFQEMLSLLVGTMLLVATFLLGAMWLRVIRRLVFSKEKYLAPFKGVVYWWSWYLQIFWCPSKGSERWVGVINYAPLPLPHMRICVPLSLSREVFIGWLKDCWGGETLINEIVMVEMSPRPLPLSLPLSGHLSLLAVVALIEKFYQNLYLWIGLCYKVIGLKLDL